MATFLLYPPKSTFHNSDGVHAVVVPAVDAASARAAASDLFVSPTYDFDNYEVVEISPTTAFAVQGFTPMGQPGNPEGIPTANRGGNKPMLKPV